ncbi:hypothetical protein HYDPIDRAFT_167810 [Hydnomerulius pinastri MD-312]|uniref:N-terminal Ras-GEF domain-containing protein n=1 Tax=Hydnomerulius pinastri MD-312 TaxID=994086 RepID=A0A0C9W103_9AGAM|nr:hypothetical protein HYDPIDRAFT_167810 [Hydnomerulius pinastri MD-312]
MTSDPTKPRSLARTRRAPSARPLDSVPRSEIAPGAKTESIDSDEPAPSSSGIFDNYDAAVPQFNLEKTFPAILAPISLLRKVAHTQDLDALRALAPIFLHCLDAILHSMTHLPERVRSSPKYQLALSGVNFSTEMFMGHVNQVSEDGPWSSQQEATQVAMQFLDMTMSSLKGYLQVAAYEVAQLKPLPKPPAQDEPDENTDDPEESDDPPSSSADDGPTVGHQSESVDSQLKQKTKLSALFKPLSLRGRGKKKRGAKSDSTAVESTGSSTLLNSDSDRSDLGCGYVHVSTNIRNSLAKFPVSIGGSVIENIAHPEDATELWKDRNGLVELASLKALVRYLTTKGSDGDLTIVDVFFLCFRFFSNPMETFNTLVARYDENPTPHLSTPQARAESLHIRMRIARLLYLWVDLHWRQEEDAEVFAPLTQFAFSRLSQDIPRDTSSKLINALHDHACRGDISRGRRVQRAIARAEAHSRPEMLCSTWEPREKKAMLKGDFSKVKIQHFNCPGGHAMLALQLTLLLWEKYCAFEPEDAVHYLMVRKGDDTTPSSEVAQKVATFMSYEKALHRFVMDTIGSAESVEVRAELMEFFLDWASVRLYFRLISGNANLKASRNATNSATIRDPASLLSLAIAQCYSSGKSHAAVVQALTNNIQPFTGPV